MLEAHWGGVGRIKVHREQRTGLRNQGLAGHGDTAWAKARRWEKEGIGLPD